MEVVNYEKILLCMIGVMKFFCSFSATDSRENDYGDGFFRILWITAVLIQILERKKEVVHLFSQ